MKNEKRVCITLPQPIHELIWKGQTQSQLRCRIIVHKIHGRSDLQKCSIF